MHSKGAAEPGPEDGPSSAFYPSGPLRLGAGSEKSLEREGQEDHGRGRLPWHVALNRHPGFLSHVSGLLCQKPQDQEAPGFFKPPLTQPDREQQASRGGYRPQGAELNTYQEAGLRRNPLQLWVYLYPSPHQRKEVGSSWGFRNPLGRQCLACLL